MLFHSQRIKFNPVDPLADGLGDEIIREQLEPEAITLDDGIDGHELSESWQSMVSEIERDPDWFRFTEE